MTKTELNMCEIERTVYHSLKESAEAIGVKVDQQADFQSKADCGRYSEKEINDNIMPEIARLRREINDDADHAINTANTLVNEWWNKKLAENLLDPAMLTDDVKLLQPGIILTEDDVQAIVDRSMGNKTMTRIAMRYADKHGFKVKTKDLSAVDEIALRKYMEANIFYFRKHIGTSDAMKMLNKFFGLA